jgi:hypothetical protein
MKFTQKQIDEMDSTEMLSNIALAIVEKDDEIVSLRDANEEFKPMLKEVLEANVEIVEEVENEDSESISVELNRVDAVNS